MHRAARPLAIGAALAAVAAGGLAFAVAGAGDDCGEQALERALPDLRAWPGVADAQLTGSCDLLEDMAVAFTITDLPAVRKQARRACTSQPADEYGDEVYRCTFAGTTGVLTLEVEYSRDGTPPTIRHGTFASES